jgi:hypothetical protein
MRRSHWISLGVCTFILFLPILTHAAGAFSGSIDPTYLANKCNCPPNSAPDYGCVLQLIQSLMNFLVYFATIIMTLLFAMAGFEYMTSGGNPEKRSQANRRILNVFIGLIIVFAAWLIVDSVMKVLYNPDAASGSVKFGPWNQLLKADGAGNCILPRAEPPSLPSIAGNNAGGGVPVAPPQATGPGVCNASKVAADAQKGGVTMSPSESKTLACMAKNESSCGTKMANYKYGAGSSAYGPYQILLSTNANCFTSQACSAAAGVSGPLNCKAGFSNGNPIPGSAIAHECEAAASDATCSAVAADCLYREGHNSFAPAYKSSAKDLACITTYGT